MTFSRRDDHREAARERLRRAEAGESGAAKEQDVRFVQNFEEFDDVERPVRTSNPELLRPIVAQRSESIRDAATTVDRDYRDVHRNLQGLESLGVVESETHGNHRKPILRNGAESIDLSIRFPEPVDGGERPGASA